MKQKSLARRGRLFAYREFVLGAARTGLFAAAGLVLGSMVVAGTPAWAQAPAIAATGGLDCNGLSPVQQPTISALRHICLDVAPAPGESRTEDNDTYIGHDEPLVTFYSSVPGSGNNTQWEFTLPRERPLPASQSFQNYVTFWVSMALCDPKSEPFGPCTPNSDLNNPKAAGSAILELQFYPPGEALAPQEFSCDLAKWCAALNIDSLTRNNKCFEPINFAQIQRDGIPAGPPGPGNQTLATFTPTAQTLLMNQGDRIRVTVKDTPDGLLTRVEDLTTKQTGFMVASAANGFQNTDRTTCATAPFSFHPEFSTAGIDNIVPWALARANVSFALEIGHFESRDNDPDDQFCFNASPVNGPLVAGCFGSDSDFDGTSYQADWPDGGTTHPTSVRITSSRGHGIGPISAFTDGKGKDHYVNPYATLQFETGASASDPACVSPTNCFLPPQGAKFYPFYALRLPDRDGRDEHDEHKERERSEHCALIVGNFTGPGVNNFGGIAQYGSPDTARAFQEHVSAVQLNPCLPRIGGRDDDEDRDRD